ncbi:MAG TPA: ATP-binding protein [Oscillatoriaceae cyanobacterium]
MPDSVQQDDHTLERGFERSFDLIGVVQGGALVVANRPLRALLALSPVEAFAPMPLEKLVGAPELDTLRQRLERVLAGEDVKVGELHLRCADGSRAETEFMGFPVTWRDHPAVQVVGRDIGARMAHEALLVGEREILERVATGAPLKETLVAITRLVEALGQGVIATIIRVDPQGRIHVAAAPSLPAWFSEAIDGEPIGPHAGTCGTAAYYNETITTPDILHDPHWTNYRELAVRAGLAACWSTPLLDHAGQVVGTLAHYYRVPQDPTPHDLKLSDIARHLAEIAIEHDRGIQALKTSNEELERRVHERTQALQATERLLREAQQLAHVGGWNWNVKTGVLRWSDELKRIFGLDSQPFQGTFEGFLERVHPDDRERVRASAEHALESHLPFENEERIVRPSGEVRILASRGRIELDAAGKVEQVWGVCFDVTEQKRAEAQREASERREREAQVEAQAAQEAARLKAHFVNAISHDLRTPLTAIIGFIELIEDGAGGPVTEAQREFLRGIRYNSRRVQRLVDDLLDSARLEAGTFHLITQPTDLKGVATEVVDSLRAQAEAAGVGLDLAMPEAPVVATMDPQRVEQVTANLLTNAIKFAPKGSRVVVAVSAAPDHVRLAVSDRGPGISPEERSKLFQPFSQLKDGMRKGGTGLGLAIAKELIQAHGGQIGLESQPGDGTTFWFELPRTPSP